MPAKKKTKIKNHVVIVLDASGSMLPIRKESRNHFNEQIEELRKCSTKDIETDVTLISFDSEVTKVYDSVPLKDVKNLTDEDYTPGGMTALYDAIAMGISLTEKKKDSKDKNTSVLLSIITDGHENASQEHRGENGRLIIKKKLEDLQKTKRWTVSFLGANIDTESVAVKGLGLNTHNVMSFKATSAGMGEATRGTNVGTNAYMVNLSKVAASGGGNLSTDKFYDPEADTSEESTTA